MLASKVYFCNQANTKQMKTSALNLAFLIYCLFGAASAGSVMSSEKNFETIKNVKGRYQYYYDENSECDELLIINVGTAMSVSSYSNLGKEIAEGTSTIAIIVDNAPNSIVKTSEKSFAKFTNAIVKNISDLIPACKTMPKNGIFIGGHSAGGQATIIALEKNLLDFDVQGYIGLAPYEVIAEDTWSLKPPFYKEAMSISVPALLWGFSKTSCAVSRDNAAVAAYKISSPEAGRVYYEVQTDNFNTLTGGPHCSFANSGCAGMCSGGSKYSFIPKEVAHSIGLFAKACVLQKFERSFFALRRADVELYVNEDPAPLNTGLIGVAQPAFAAA